MRTALGVAMASLAFMVACGAKEPPASEEDDGSFVAGGSDTNATESDVQLVTSSLVVSSATDTATLASMDDFTALYLPRRCVSVADDAAGSRTFTFTGCYGPAGLTVTSGTISVRYSMTAAGALHLDLVGTDVRINDATVDWSASAEIAKEGTGRVMTWKASLSGTTAGHRSVSRRNDHRITWTPGDPCFSLAGVSEGQINKRDVRVEITDFRRCRRACPDAGGKIVVTNVTKNKHFEIRYDGSNIATYIAPNGTSTSFPLLCRN